MTNDRKHLTAAEVGKSLEAMRCNRFEARHLCLLLVKFRSDDICTLKTKPAFMRWLSVSETVFVTI